MRKSMDFFCKICYYILILIIGDIKVANKKRKQNQKSKIETNKKSIVPEIIAVSFVAIAFFVIAAMFTESTGYIGSAIRDVFLGLFSVSAFFIPFIVLAIGTNLIIEKQIKRYRYIYVSVGFILLIISAMFEFFSNSTHEGNFFETIGELFISGSIVNGGGVFGGLINIGLSNLIGSAGTIIVYLAGLLICVIAIFRISLVDNAEKYAKNIKNVAEQHKHQREIEKEEKRARKLQAIKNALADEDDDKTILPATTEYQPKIITNDDTEYDEIIIPEEEDIIIGPDSPIIPETIESPYTDTVIEPDNQVALNMESGTIPEPTYYNDGEYEFIENYVFPGVDMLKPNKKGKKSTKESDLMNNARKLVDTLDSFGVKAKILQVSKGPTITRYELQPMAGVKVSKIVNLADDIALNLAAQGVRIEAPIPGKAAIGIEVPNNDVDMVSMREVIDTDEFKNHPSKLAVALGKDISGSPIIIDLAKMPHLLIAGATGSGKSVCINSIITSIMYKANPNEVKLLLIDPKVVELKVYDGIPHLDTPVVTKAKKAAGALSWAVTEMMKRYDMFSEAKVRDIKGYNAVAAEKGLRQMPQVVIIIDELADLMMVAPNEVEDSICRLAQLARAAGMHLVIATQRPSVNVITGIIKANIPSRIAFAVSSQVDSRTILDMAGAEKLLGRGDMLYHPVGSSKPKRIQGAFISDSEVEKLVTFVKNNACAHYNHDIDEHIAKHEQTDREKTEVSDPGDIDELLPKAIDIIMELGQASTSMIQRKLSVGYARAGRIMDQMEERGIVGPSEGSKPRQILLTKEQYLELKATGIFEEPKKY